eukprot:tig00020849_g14642.t1
MGASGSTPGAQGGARGGGPTTLAANDPRAFKGATDLNALRQRLAKERDAEGSIGAITRRYEAYLLETRRTHEKEPEHAAEDFIKTERRARNAASALVVPKNEITAMAAKAWAQFKEVAAGGSGASASSRVSFLAAPAPEEGESVRSRGTERRAEVHHLLGVLQNASGPADTFKPLDDLARLLASSAPARAEAAGDKAVLVFLVTAATARGADPEARVRALLCISALLSNAENAKPAEAVRAVWSVQDMFSILERLRDDVEAHQAVYRCVAGVCRAAGGCRALVKAGLHERLLEDLTDPCAL